MGESVAQGIAAVQEALAAGDADLGFELVDALVQRWPASARIRSIAAALCAEEGFGDLAREHAAAAVANARGDLAVYSAHLSLMKLGEPVDPVAFADAHRVYGRYVEASRTYRRAGRVEGPVRIVIAGLDAHIALVRFLPSLLDHVPEGVGVAIASRNPDLLASLARRWPSHARIELPPEPQRQIEAVLAHAPGVLLDLAGHAPNNVLHLLAARCAPVQVTWLDYLATTGLATVDGRITDHIADPPGNEAFHTEAVWRLPVSPWCYEPWPGSGGPVARPRDGPLRIGSACVPAKLNTRSLKLFARVLEALPDATLTLAGFRSRRAVARVREAFGPTLADRVECLPRLPLPAYLEFVAALDLALDTVGFSGGTSTLDALWHGVPVVTLPLVLSHTRSSASLLAGAGLHELVAASDEDYVATACRVAHDDREHPTRRTERLGRVRSSPLCDAPAFARAFYASLLAAAKTGTGPVGSD